MIPCYESPGFPGIPLEPPPFPHRKPQLRHVTLPWRPARYRASRCTTAGCDAGALPASPVKKTQGFAGKMVISDIINGCNHGQKGPCTAQNEVDEPLASKATTGTSGRVSLRAGPLRIAGPSHFWTYHGYAQHFLCSGLH